MLEIYYLGRWTFKNGDYIEGKTKTAITPSETTNTANILIEGVYKYSNGDRFEGEVSACKLHRLVCAFLIKGLTAMAKQFTGSNDGQAMLPV